MTYNYECFCNVSMLCYAILIIRFAIECIAMCKDKMQAVLIFQTMLSVKSHNFKLSLHTDTNL